jgi:hypothetical protein
MSHTKVYKLFLLSACRRFWASLWLKKLTAAITTEFPQLILITLDRLNTGNASLTITPFKQVVKPNTWIRFLNQQPCSFPYFSYYVTLSDARSPLSLSAGFLLNILPQRTSPQEPT